MNETFSECKKCHTLNRISSERAIQSPPLCGHCKEALKLYGLVSDISQSAFQKILKSTTKSIVVDFWASWCGPCRTYAPEFEKASLENKNTIFLIVNTETEQDLANQFGIRGIPCTIKFDQGKESKRQSGVMNAQQIKNFLGN
jgi:thioredoxin 2